MSSRKLLKVNGTPESLPTAWELKNWKERKKIKRQDLKSLNKYFYVRF